MDSELINLDELRSLYGEDSVRELLEMSLKEGRTLIDSLKTAVPAKNAAVVAADAHQLKGMSATMTMNKLSAEAYKLEMVGKNNSFDGSDVMLANIVSMFADIEQLVTKVLA